MKKLDEETGKLFYFLKQIEIPFVFVYDPDTKEIYGVLPGGKMVRVYNKDGSPMRYEGGLIFYEYL